MNDIKDFLFFKKNKLQRCRQQYELHGDMNHNYEGNMSGGGICKALTCLRCQNKMIAIGP